LKFKVSILGLLLAGCSQTDVPAAPQQKEPDHLFFFAAAEDDSPRPWAVLLTGGGGIDIFGDEGAYYFSVAEMLNARGIDALVVDYLPVATPAEEIGMENYGGEIARVTDEGVAFERAQGRMDARCDGLVFSWSMGGEGLFEMAARDSMALPGLGAAYAYYPSVNGRPEGFAASIPVTVFQGSEDELTPLATLESFIAASETPESIDLHVFDGAKHGFDITTLAEPVLGGSFEYDAAHAEAAAAMLGAMLDEADYGCALD
jgi:dienelactone hydrolase